MSMRCAHIERELSLSLSVLYPLSVPRSLLRPPPVLWPEGALLAKLFLPSLHEEEEEEDGQPWHGHWQRSAQSERAIP